MRQRILTATRAVWRAEGLEGLSMRKVARRVGVTATALYRHYDGKGALVAELVDEARAVFERHLEGAARGATPRARLLRAADAYLAFALGHRRLYEVLLLTPSEQGMLRLLDSAERWRRDPPRTFRMLVDRVEECQRAGVLRAGDPTETAFTIWGLAHGLVSLFHAGRFGRDRRWFRGLFRASIRRLLEGLER